jgi:hypothetical protein
LAKQVFQFWHEAEFWVVENVPAMHGVQVRSLVPLPATVENPVEQLLQAWQVLRFADVVKVPLAHASQTRSVVAVAAVLMRVPAAQLVNAWQPRSRSALGVRVWYSFALHWVHGEHELALTCVL